MWLLFSSWSRSDFLVLDAAQDVVLEDARPAKDARLVVVQGFAVRQFAFGQFDCANKVGKLKQLVVLWADGLRELDLSTEFGGKGVVQQLGDWSLPAVVIDFQRVKCIGPDGTRIKELAKLVLQTFDDLPG